MKIDASRYNLFWSNPERYRLREIWKLAPIEPKADSFAALLTYGRRRGTCTHELLDGKYRGVPREQSIAELKDGGFGDKEIAAALRLVSAVEERYPGEAYLAHEAVFEYQISDSPHVMTGRVDHILPSIQEGAPPIIGDWKSSRKRTKKEMAALIDSYKASAQVSFYMLGVPTLGFAVGDFLYRILEDRGPKEKPRIYEAWTTRGSLELAKFARGVHQTCELIEWMKRTFGVENPWPNLWEPFDKGYSSMLGQKMFEGFMPEGFTERVEHLETMDDYEPEEPDAV